MSRVRTVHFNTWIAIISIVLATKAGRATTSELMIGGLLALAVFAGVWTCRRRVVLFRGMFIVAVVFMGSAYGLAFSRWCPGHPLTPLGVPTQIRASVTSSKVKNHVVEVLLHVTRDGSPPHRCSYTALWIPPKNAGQVTTGQTLQLSGLFVQSSTPTNVVKDWLSPLWLFRGHSINADTPNTVNSPIRAIRTAMEESVPSSSRPTADLALSMVIGRASTISPTTQMLFLQSGATHLLAASGANVALICRFASLLWRWGSRLLRVQAHFAKHVFLLGVVWSFVLLCGSATPITRAALLASYMICAGVFYRSVRPMTALSISCFLFCLVRPYDFTSASGVLSLVATFAVYQTTTKQRRVSPSSRTNRDRHIVVVWMKTTFKFIGYHFLELLKVSIVVDIYMLPLVWWWFQQFTPYGALSTLLLEPMLIFMLPMTIIWGVLAVVSHILTLPLLLWGASLCAESVIATLQLATAILQFISTRPFSLNQMPVLPLWVVLSYFVGVTLWQRIRFPTLLIQKGKGRDSV